MNGKAIIYPYWENIARGLEDILMVLTMFAVLFLVYPAIVIILGIRKWWKQRKWTIKSIIKKIKGGVRV